MEKQLPRTQHSPIQYGIELFRNKNNKTYIKKNQLYTMEENNDNCENCGEPSELIEMVDGVCPRCGIRYWWEDYYDEETDETTTIVRWDY